ncbi:MAG: DUF3419 family protein [Bacteroidota bacterium]
MLGSPVMQLISQFVENLRYRFFKAVTSNNLVYNTCWEDPRIDRQLLQLNSQSKLLMLTSAGDNALDYLLDNPRKIDSVDINPAQNALLELKKSILKNGEFSLLWDFFGNGRLRNPYKKYATHLLRQLPTDVAQYWDQHMEKFKSGGRTQGFYFSGTSGKVAQLIISRIHRKGLFPSVQKLLQAESLAEQSYYFDELEPQLWTPFSRWLVGRHAAMTLLGVPAAQRKMIEERYQHGMVEFIRKSLRHVFTELPIADNYFWRVYLTGRYTRGCCPNYLRESNFLTLSNRVSRITTHTTSLLDFLKQTDQRYSHFVLLDHQDWMAFAQPGKLTEQWKEILAHAQPGARILFRSAGDYLTFLPDFVFDRLTFKPEITTELHQQDRVGTYESTHLAIVE